MTTKRNTTPISIYADDEVKEKLENLKKEYQKRFKVKLNVSNFVSQLILDFKL